MNVRWRWGLLVGVLLLAFVAGLLASIWSADREVMQGGEAEEQIYIDLNQVMLYYHDQLRGIGPQHLTIRQVIQDALWYQVNSPGASEQVRMECFAMIGLFHEGRATAVTQEQYDILISAMRVVWGPAILEEFETMVGGGEQ